MIRYSVHGPQSIVQPLLFIFIHLHSSSYALPTWCRHSYITTSLGTWMQPSLMHVAIAQKHGHKHKHGCTSCWGILGEEACMNARTGRERAWSLEGAWAVWCSGRRAGWTLRHWLSAIMSIESFSPRRALVLFVVPCGPNPSR